MLDIGWPELLVVVIVLIVIVGPKSAIEMARDFSGVLKKLKRTAGDFRSQFDDALKEADLEDVKDLVNDVKDLNPKTHLKSALDPLNKMGDEVKHDFNKIMADAEPSAAAKSVAAKTKTAAKKPAAKKPATKSAATTKKPAAKKPAAKTSAAKKPAAKKPAAKKTATKAAQKPKSDAS